MSLSIYIFSDFSETSGPVVIHVCSLEGLWGTKTCSDGPGHMAKLATMPIQD